MREETTKIAFIGVAFTVGLLASCIEMLSVALWIPVTMPAHELGHAAAHWLTGAFAIPTFFMTAVFGEPSLFLGAGITFVLGGILFWAFKKRRYSLTGIIGILLLLQLTATFVAPAVVQKQFGIASGLGGEAFFAPLFLALSYENFGGWWRRHRMILACAAVASLGKSIGEWLGILLKVKPLPYGSLLFGEEHGDINQLIDTFGWSQEGLVSLFLGVALLSTIVCCGQILVSLGRRK